VGGGELGRGGGGGGERGGGGGGDGGGDRARRSGDRFGRSDRRRDPGGRRWTGPQLLPGPGGVRGPRWPPRQAAAGADRRHLLRQPLVRDGRAEAEDADPDRLRRRGRVVLRARGPL